MLFKSEHEKQSVIYYQGTIETEFREELEKKGNHLVSQDLNFSFRFLDYKELERESIYFQSGLPSGVADGGTQVHSISEVGCIFILPI